MTFQIFSNWLLLTKLPVIHFLTVSCASKCKDKELLRAFCRHSLSFIGSLPLFIHPTASLWGMTEGVLETTCPGFSESWGIGASRVYTCLQRCKPSSAFRKYNMIGAWPNIVWFSHSGCCLGKMSRRLLMTLVCYQPYLRELKNCLVIWSIRKKKNRGSCGKNRSEKKLPSPAAMSILHFHTMKKKKSGNWQRVFLWLSDHELLMGTLVPLSLGTGIFCYFEGPSFSSYLVKLWWWQKSVEFHNMRAIFSKNGQYPWTWSPLTYCVMWMCVFVCICVSGPLDGHLQDQWFPLGPRISSLFSLLIWWDWLACSCHSLHRSPSTRACRAGSRTSACHFSPTREWEWKDMERRAGLSGREAECMALWSQL